LFYFLLKYVTHLTQKNKVEMDLGPQGSGSETHKSKMKLSASFQASQPRGGGILYEATRPQMLHYSLKGVKERPEQKHVLLFLNTF
jgi:hypothetical protein